MSAADSHARCPLTATGSYCSQSSRYSTPTQASRLVDIEPVIEAARRAKENGSTRFCMGAAWRDLNGRKRSFDRILEMVRQGMCQFTASVSNRPTVCSPSDGHGSLHYPGHAVAGTGKGPEGGVRRHVKRVLASG